MQQLEQTIFGEHLRREREMRGVTLEEVSVATRIPPRYLDALEAEQWEQLPGGVFNRGFVRAIAKFLGLGEDDMLAEYESASRPAREAAAPAAKPEMPPPRDMTPVYIFGGICVAVILGLALGLHLLVPRVAHWRKARAERAANAATVSFQMDPDASRPPTANAATSAPVTQPAAIAPAAPAATTPATASEATATSPAPLAPPTQQAPVNAPVTAPATGAANAAAAAAVVGTGNLELKVVVMKKTSVMVNGDGQVMLSRHMVPGDTRTFRASDHFDVAAGIPSAVRLELNGQRQPPLPASTGRWNVTLNQDSLKKSKGGRH